MVFGCASSPYQILPEWDKDRLATVSIYRTKTFFHSANPERPYFYIDDRKVGTLGTGMALTTKVESGKHFISVREPILFMPAFESERLEHDFETGKEYFIRYSKDFSGIALIGSSATATGSSKLSVATKASFLARE